VKIAALYDIHGNLPALEAVLAEVEHADVDLIVVGGDVAAGPMPVETLDRLRGLGGRARFVTGNADRELVEAFDAGASPDGGEDTFTRQKNWAAAQLDLGEHRREGRQVPVDVVEGRDLHWMLPRPALR
jgi:predicted phosphodiesterase